MKRRWPRILLISICAVAVAALLTLFAPVSEYWRAQSPDGAFVAIAHIQPIYRLIGDAPGRVTVYRGSASCGSAWVPQISSSRAYLLWQVNQNPRRVEVRPFVVWNLDDCLVEQMPSR
jgi:hypothetical protein